MYGGGNEELDNSGYRDGEHGTLMMFAGSSNAQSVANSKFRVYRDGTVYWEKGVSTGLHKYKTITINNANVDQYFPITNNVATLSTDGTVAQRSLSVESLCSITEFSSLFTKYSNVSIHLPAIHDYTLHDDLGLYTKSELREFAGTTFYIYNNSSSFVHLCGYTFDPEENIFSGPVCFGDGVIEKGMFAKVTCVIDVVNGKELLYWKYQIGRSSRMIIPM